MSDTVADAKAFARRERKPRAPKLSAEAREWASVFDDFNGLAGVHTLSTSRRKPDSGSVTGSRGHCSVYLHGPGVRNGCVQGLAQTPTEAYAIAKGKR